MASAEAEGEATVNGRLQGFLSALFASIGGVFGTICEEEGGGGGRGREEMAARAVGQQPRGRLASKSLIFDSMIVPSLIRSLVGVFRTLLRNEVFFHLGVNFEFGLVEIMK